VHGDARTQLTQLIANFNELITTNENWRSSYDKVNANVVALLGPDMPEPSQAPAAGAPVAVGTSGTAAATLDPAVRAKLVEFRNQLTEFEKAAGADKPAASAASAATPAAAATVVTTTAPPSSPATEQSAASPQPAEVMGQNSALAHIDAIEAILTRYFAGETDALDVIDVEMNGTSFQRRVWAALRDVKAGTTVSYGEIARRIGAPSAVRAVGAANGANPVAIVVPCHRVIGGNGSLTGYGGGLERKQWLLRHEQAPTLF